MGKTGDCDPAWSPDGTEIAFDTGGGIDLMRPDGSHRTQVVSDGSNPDWSPDSMKLIFEKYVGTCTDVFEVSSDGTGLTQVTHTPNRSEHGPVFSPDGTKIAFSRSQSRHCRQQSADNIWVAKADGTGSKRITSTRLMDEVGLSWQAT